MGCLWLYSRCILKKEKKKQQKSCKRGCIIRGSNHGPSHNWKIKPILLAMLKYENWKKCFMVQHVAARMLVFSVIRRSPRTQWRCFHVLVGVGQWFGIWSKLELHRATAERLSSFLSNWSAISDLCDYFGDINDVCHCSKIFEYLSSKIVYLETLNVAILDQLPYCGADVLIMDLYEAKFCGLFKNTRNFAVSWMVREIQQLFWPKVDTFLWYCHVRKKLVKSTVWSSWSSVRFPKIFSATWGIPKLIILSILICWIDS